MAVLPLPEEYKEFVQDLIKEASKPLRRLDAIEVPQLELLEKRPSLDLMTDFGFDWADMERLRVQLEIIYATTEKIPDHLTSLPSIHLFMLRYRPE